MSASQPLQVFNLYDVLTDLIPGAVILLFIGLLFPIEQAPMINMGTVTVFIFIIVSIIIGHLVQWIRNWRIFRQPNAFQHTMAVAHDDANQQKDQYIEQTAIVKNIRDFVDSYFQTDSNTNDNERFLLMLSFLESRPSTRALRFQSIYSFYRSMFVASIIIGLFSMVAIISYFENIVPVRSWPVILLITSLVFFLIIAFRTRRDKFEKVFVGYVIREFYIEMVRDTKQS